MYWYIFPHRGRWRATRDIISAPMDTADQPAWAGVLKCDCTGKTIAGRAVWSAVFYWCRYDVSNLPVTLYIPLITLWYSLNTSSVPSHPLIRLLIFPHMYNILYIHTYSRYFQPNYNKVKATPESPDLWTNLILLRVDDEIGGCTSWSKVE